MWERNGEELGREKGKPGEGREPSSSCPARLWGSGDAIFLPTVYPGTWESKGSACFTCFCIIFSMCSHWTKAVLWQAHNALYPPFIWSVLQICGYFSGSHVGSFSSFLRNDYLQACYVKSYNIAHNTQALSNGPPWNILVNTRQGPSGLMSVLLSGMTIRHLQGLSPVRLPENRKGEISEVNTKFVYDLAYALLENKYLFFFLINNLYVTYF